MYESPIPEARSFRGDEDRVRMLALARQNPAISPHVVDLPYRLSSWAFDNPDNAVLWETGSGRLLAWAVLQPPFWQLDAVIDPAAPSGMHRTLLAWVDERARRLLGTPYGRRAWYTAVRESWAERRRELEAAGYISNETGEDAWSQLVFRLDAGTAVPRSKPRPGFAVRPLRGASEVPAYVTLHRAVFESTNMTEGWRAATLRQPDYRPDLDLVVEGPDGELVAFCVLWHAVVGGTSLGQIEPLGVKRDARRFGVAWAIITEGIARLRDLGTEHILVHTDNYRDNAYAFYQAVGFRPLERLLIYGKEFA